MAKIHELYGIQSEELENLKAEYEKVLGLIQRVQRGEVHLDRIVIKNNSWEIKLPKIETVNPYSEAEKSEG